MLPNFPLRVHKPIQIAQFCRGGRALGASKDVDIQMVVNR